MLYCMDEAESLVGRYTHTYDWETIAEAWEGLGFDARAKDAKTKAE